MPRRRFGHRSVSAGAAPPPPGVDERCDDLEAELRLLDDREHEVEQALLRESRLRRTAETQARRLERSRGELARNAGDAADAIAQVIADLARVRASRTWRAARAIAVVGRRLGSGPAADVPSLDGAGARLAELEAGLRTPPRLAAAAAAAPADPMTAPLPPPPVPREIAGRALDVGEQRACERFLRHYALVLGLTGSDADLSEPGFADPVDRAGVLAPSHRMSAPEDRPRVDVVICIHDALPDVRACLWSLLAKTTRPFHLILVDDGSDAPTRDFLTQFVARHPLVTLVANADPPHGYTIAANLGLRASGAEIVVLLNSDTLVSYGWLDGLVGCFEADAACGIAGPLSNAASHQSIPHKREGDAWARNELPPWLTPDGMALLLREGGPPARPRLPFVNGFCFAVRRELIDRIGEFDAERFGPGYCEENDYCVRAADAGFTLAVADDSYVVHARGRSYGEDTRDALRREHYARFLAKHGAERLRPSLETMDAPGPIDAVRERVALATRDQEATCAAFRRACPNPLSVGFVMPNMTSGGSGGLHSVYQETSGLRRLGVDAVIFAFSDFMRYARAAYDDADELFVALDDPSEVEARSRGRDVLVATHFQSVRIVAHVWEQRQDFLAAYYCQDYEPFFGVNINGGTAALAEARASYDLVPGMLLFAKTHWICNAIGRVHGLPVAKVEPSIDAELFTTADRPPNGDGPVRVSAMVRPRTWRRQPYSTLMLLDRLKADLGDRVDVRSFGCTQEERDKMLGLRGIRPAVDHHGLLSRPQVAELLKDSDVFLDFSAFQGMGRTAFEGMACGCAPLVPTIGGTHEFAVDDENAVLVDPADPLATYAALRALVLDRERLARLQDAGARAAGQRSVLAAVLSEYVLFEHEHAKRFARAA